MAMPGYARGIIVLGLTATLLAGCKKSSTSAPMLTTTYDQVNLVADAASLGAAKTDPALLNAWGIAVSPTGIFWISANHSGTSTVYDTSGNTKIPPVAIPSPTAPTGGAPSGQVYNNTTGFVIPGNGKLSKFIFCTEDGTIVGWGGGAALVAADRSGANAVYKGLTIASNAGANYIYAADFHNGNIDVFDSTFAYQSGWTFKDPNIPAGFAPFNIRYIGGMLYVCYAKQKGPDNMDDQAGQGNGYVDIFKTDGSFVSRFASQGTLNSPWGIVGAGTDFGLGLLQPILIGNFGDGRINVFTSDGKYQGQLLDNSHNPISIDGLWDLYFPVNGVPNVSPYRLYFTAGPGGETHGLFGYLTLHQ